MIIDSEDNIVSFHLQCRPMREPDIYLYDITFQYTIFMVKTFSSIGLVCAKISNVYVC